MPTRALPRAHTHTHTYTRTHTHLHTHVHTHLHTLTHTLCHTHALQLLYTAEMKRPMSEPLREKKDVVDEVLERLALTTCK